MKQLIKTAAAKFYSRFVRKSSQRSLDGIGGAAAFFMLLNSITFGFLNFYYSCTAVYLL